MAVLKYKEGNEWKETQVATAYTLSDIPTPTKDELVFSERLDYWDYYGKWDWFLQKYADKIVLKNVESGSYMFYKAQQIPSGLKEINWDETLGDVVNLQGMYNEYQGITVLKNTYQKAKRFPKNVSYLFANAANLQSIPNDFFGFIRVSTSPENYLQKNRMFYACYRLRNLPDLSIWGFRNAGGVYSIYREMCSDCYMLDTILNLPVEGGTIAQTSNNFYDTFYFTQRLEDMTFNPNQIVKWKSQVIDLTSYVGWSGMDLIRYGASSDKKVTDATTYQALKNDPDWWTTNVAYSRYNHNSAVATINSLPDASEYLTTAGGTNTIKFRGAAGEKTDGGAINTLTADEIAVATAKGWTVTFV